MHPYYANYFSPVIKNANGLQHVIGTFRNRRKITINVLFYTSSQILLNKNLTF